VAWRPRGCGSAWLFIGDLGSVAGSNTWMYAQNSAVFCDGAPEGCCPIAAFEEQLLNMIGNLV
jgi:hypothetical protein